MTKDDIICMAFKAGLTYGTNMSGIGLVGSPADIGIAHITLDEMHHFADIVAAAEREACLQAVGNLIRKHKDEKDGEPEGYPDIFDAVKVIRARGQ